MLIEIIKASDCPLRDLETTHMNGKIDCKHPGKNILCCLDYEDIRDDENCPLNKTSIEIQVAILGQNQSTVCHICGKNH